MVSKKDRIIFSEKAIEIARTKGFHDQLKAAFIEAGTTIPEGSMDPGFELPPLDRQSIEIAREYVRTQVLLFGQNRITFKRCGCAECLERAEQVEKIINATNAGLVSLHDLLTVGMCPLEEVEIHGR